jgi:AbrB family looped-hinge helix DNA binding protein
MPQITMSSKGQVTLPSEMRSHLGLHTGDRLIAVELDGAVILRPVSGKSFLESCEPKAAYRGKPASVREIKDLAGGAALERFDRVKKR